MVIERKRLSRLQEMTELKNEIVNGVATILSEKTKLDFTQQHVYSWLLEALTKYSQDGWRYHDSKSGSNHYRFKVWLLHLEAEVTISHLYFIGMGVTNICEAKIGFKKELDRLMARIKVYDKMN